MSNFTGPYTVESSHGDKLKKHRNDSMSHPRQVLFLPIKPATIQYRSQLLQTKKKIITDIHKTPSTPGGYKRPAVLSAESIIHSQLVLLMKPTQCLTTTNNSLLLKYTGQGSRKGRQMLIHVRAESLEKPFMKKSIQWSRQCT